MAIRCTGMLCKLCNNNNASLSLFLSGHSLSSSIGLHLLGTEEVVDIFIRDQIGARPVAQTSFLCLNLHKIIERKQIQGELVCVTREPDEQVRAQVL